MACCYDGVDVVLSKVLRKRPKVFQHFADIWNSWDYLTDIPGSIQNSTIARSEEWNKNFKNGSEYYKRKHGFYPTQTPLVDQNVINNQLQALYNSR